MCVFSLREIWVFWPNLHTVEGMNRPLLMASVMVAWSCALCEKVISCLNCLRIKFSNPYICGRWYWELEREKELSKRSWYRGHAIWWLQMSSGTDFLNEHFVLSIFLAQIARKLRFRSIIVEASNLTIQSMPDAELTYFLQTVQRAQDIRRS